MFVIECFLFRCGYIHRKNTVTSKETVQGQNYSADSGLRGHRVNGRKVYGK